MGYRASNERTREGSLSIPIAALETWEIPTRWKASEQGRENPGQPGGCLKSELPGEFKSDREEEFKEVSFKGTTFNCSTV